MDALSPLGVGRVHTLVYIEITSLRVTQDFSQTFGIVSRRIEATQLRVGVLTGGDDERTSTHRSALEYSIGPVMMWDAVLHGC
jgi:hypothetical protein